MNNDLRYKMANLLRNYSYLLRPWFIFFGEVSYWNTDGLSTNVNLIGRNAFKLKNLIYKQLQLECCGVASSNDLCEMNPASSYCTGQYPLTCCHRNLYETTENDVYSNSFCNNLNIVRSCLFIISIGLNRNQ